MSEFITTNVTVHTDVIMQKVENAIHDEGVMTQVHQAFAEIIDPWIPYDTGNLSQDITVSAECVTYNADYASIQYYETEFNHKREHHPLATAYWDKVAMQTEKERLAREASEIVKRRLKNG